MQDFYNFLNENHYFWDRKDDNHIWVALHGYMVFDVRYEALMAEAKKVKARNISHEYDKYCGQSFYIFKHK
jgi:hypothetical protein